MESQAIALIIVLGFIALAARGKFVSGKTAPHGTLNVRATPILSNNEREFFHRLIRAIPNHHIFPQVGFGAILQPGRTRSYRERMSNLGRFNQKRADFVVCAPETLEVLAVIELDDSTHMSDRDRKRDEILTAGGYRVLRFHSKRKPSEAEIASHFEMSEANSF